MKTTSSYPSRRTILRGGVAALGLAVAGLPGAASAATYPDKPIRLIVPFPPGGGTDLTARIAAEGLSRSLGQNVVVENVEGAASQIGIEQAAKSTNDGYTLLWASSDGITILPAVKPSVPYKIPDDFEFVSGFASDPLIVAVNPKLPIKSMKDLVEYGKAHPGELKYSSSGVGGGGHLETAYIAKVEGIDMVHVPYRGAAPAVVAVTGGFADLTLPSSASVMSYLTAGTLRAVASTGQNRMKVLPDLATVGEQGMPELTVDLCTGIYAPAGTPADIVKTIRDHMSAIIQDPKTVQRLHDLGLEPLDIGGKDFRDYQVKDLAHWREIVQKVGVKLGG
ncbi:hypothetical protein LMIY3S_01300 [Labrys miyagiensis]